MFDPCEIFDRERMFLEHRDHTCNPDTCGLCYQERAKQEAALQIPMEEEPHERYLGIG